MKMTESELKQIIQEEIDQMIEEGFLDRLRARASGVGRGASGVAQRARGTARYAATGEAPTTKGSVGGAYAAGKAGKIITLHGRKLRKALRKSQTAVMDRLKDFKNDVQKLDLDKAETDVFQDLYTDILEVVAKLEKAIVDTSALFSGEAESFDDFRASSAMTAKEKKPQAEQAGTRYVPSPATA